MPSLLFDEQTAGKGDAFYWETKRKLLDLEEKDGTPAGVYLLEVLACDYPKPRMDLNAARQRDNKLSLLQGKVCITPVF